MQRVWMVTPDRLAVTATGEQLEVVSQEALVKAFYDAAIVMDRLGGCVFVQANRGSTGVNGEKVTTLAQVVWKHRTDARETPEQPGTLVAAPAPAAEPVELAPEATGDSDGEFVDVDESAVPLRLREGA